MTDDFDPNRPFRVVGDHGAEFDDFGIRGAGYGGRVRWSDGSIGMAFWDYRGKSRATPLHDLENLEGGD